MYCTNILVASFGRIQATRQTRRFAINALTSVGSLHINSIHRLVGDNRAISDIQSNKSVHSVSGEWANQLTWKKLLKRCGTDEKLEDVSKLLTHLADKRTLNASVGNLISLCEYLARNEYYDLVHKILSDSLDTLLSKRDISAKEHFVLSGLPKLFDAVLSVYKNKNEWRQVHKMIHLLHERSIDPSLRIFRVFLVACATSNRKEHVHKTIQYLYANKFVSSLDDAETMKTLTACCQALLLIGQSDRVIQLLRHLKEDLPSSKYDAASRNSDFLWIRLRKLIRFRDTIRLNLLVQAYISEDQEKEVLKTLAWMQGSKQAAPNCLTFEVILQFLLRRKQWTKVLTIYDQAHYLESESGGKTILINLASLTAALTAWKSLEQSQQLKSVYRQNAANIWNRLVKYDISTSEEHQVLQLFDCLWRYGCREEAAKFFLQAVSSTSGSIWRRRNWIRQLSSGAIEVDLHGFSCGAAQSAVLFVLHELERERPLMEELNITRIGRNWQPDIRFITGVGRHNRRNYMHAELRTRITILLNELSPQLKPSQCNKNSGVLLLTGQNIRRWMKER